MLLYAFEDNSFEREYFLDLETGRIEILFTDDAFQQEDEDLQESIEAHEGRYWRIDPIEPRESFSIMEKFISTIQDTQAAESLRRALTGRKPFRNFKETLTHYMDIREQWFLFKQRELKRLAIEELKVQLEKLKNSGIEITFLPLPGETS